MNDMAQCRACGFIGTDLSNHKCDPENIQVGFTQADRDRIVEILKILGGINHSKF